jgi:lysyl-tRNA synthetase class 2
MARTTKTLDSSVLAAVTYDSATQILEVEFRTGRIYWYFDLPQAVFDALIASDSTGAYFNHEIRDHYSFREL